MPGGSFIKSLSLKKQSMLVQIIPQSKLSISMMKLASTAVAVLLLVAVGPASAGRPFDGVTSWFAEHFKAAEAQLSTAESKKTPWFCHDLDCPPFAVGVGAGAGVRLGWHTEEASSGLYSVSNTDYLQQC